MIETGQPAPDFELPDQDGNPVSLTELRGKKIVLYFYPKADTRCVICSNVAEPGTSRHRHRQGLASRRARGRVVRLAC